MYGKLFSDNTNWRQDKKTFHCQLSKYTVLTYIHTYINNIRRFSRGMHGRVGKTKCILRMFLESDVSYVPLRIIF